MEISVPICLKHAFAYSETDPSIEKFCEMLNDCLKQKNGSVNKQGRFIIKVSILQPKGNAGIYRNTDGLPA